MKREAPMRILSWSDSDTISPLNRRMTAHLNRKLAISVVCLSPTNQASNTPPGISNSGSCTIKEQPSPGNPAICRILIRHYTIRRPSPPLQRQRASHNRNARKCHSSASHHRVHVQANGEEYTHGERDTENVVYTCPYEISLDDCEDGSR